MNKRKGILVFLLCLCTLGIVTTIFMGNRMEEQNYTFEQTESDRQDTVAEGVEAEFFFDLEKSEGVSEKTIEKIRNGYYTTADSKAVLTAVVPESGYYALHFEYFAESDRGATINRDFLINGKTGVTGYTGIEFGRLYIDDPEEVGREDLNGNEIRPAQIELQSIQSMYARNTQGLFNDPYVYYLVEGENTLEIIGVSEPVTLLEVKAVGLKKVPAYKDYLKLYDEPNEGDVEPIMIEAEKTTYKSSPTLYGRFDRTGPNTSPYEPGKQLLNMLGGSTWNKAGQFAVWEFEVPKNGWYTLHLKVRQNINRDFRSTRTIYIDGEVPFQEFSAWEFAYHEKWQMITPANDEGAFRIYLKEGKHELKLEAAMGIVAEQSEKVQDILERLNGIYTDILIITGSNPDSMRDYRLGTLIPDIAEQMNGLAGELQEVADWMEGYSSRGQNAAALDISIRQLRKMADDTDLIPKELSFFKTNNGNLANWLIQARNQALEIDYFLLTYEESPKLPKANAGFFEQFAFSVGNFFSSFSEDTQTLGTAYQEADDVITVWIPTGRDQAQVLRKLIDQYFTPETGVRVNLQLVSSGSLLPATVADNGPDVALSMGDTEPVNYAIRDAVIDLTRFPDFEEVAKRFLLQRMVPLTFDGKVYALPETQNFNVMFYRTDVLEELDVEVPKTWTDVIATIPLLIKNNMNFALPVSVPRADLIEAGTSAFYTMLFQEGGQIYKDGGVSSELNSVVGQEAFTRWTNLYVNYALPREYDFLTTFRTGENPIIVGNYANYNTLMVSAPEIKGQWSFSMVPGTVKEDGTVDYSTPLSGVNCFIMKNSDNYEASWEFLKWWTSADIQLAFGQEMECILGESARYATANVEAFSKTAWDSKFYAVLEEQMQWGKGIEQVPGGYFTGRHLNNAFRQVVIAKEDVRETLWDYVYVIDQELAGKRKEFGLPVER